MSRFGREMITPGMGRIRSKKTLRAVRLVPLTPHTYFEYTGAFGVVDVVVVAGAISDNVTKS